MKKFMNWLEQSFSPVMRKINNNVWVTTIKDSIMQVLPFIFVGSIFVMLAILNDYIPSLPNFWTPFGWTMGVISLFVAFLIPFNLMERTRNRKNRVNAGLSGLIVFMIVITPQLIADGTPGFGHEALGAGGMFVSIFSGVLSGLVFLQFSKFTFFSDDSALPDFIKAWFDSMLPIAIVVVISWVLVDIIGLDLYTIILSVFKPLANLIESPLGFSFTMFIFTFLYSLGISSWVLTPVVTPVLLEAITANMNSGAQNLVTDPTIYSAYLWMGGIGATMPLVIMALRSKSARISALGKASVGPTVFNINEPIVFGLIAWNPYLMVPMWLNGLILPLTTWLLTKTIPFAPIPDKLFQLWYMPFPFSTWLTTGSITGILLMLINLLIATIIWLPFFRVYEKQVLREENS